MNLQHLATFQDLLLGFRTGHSLYLCVNGLGIVHSLPPTTVPYESMRVWRITIIIFMKMQLKWPYCASLTSEAKMAEIGSNSIDETPTLLNNQNRYGI